MLCSPISGLVCALLGILPPVTAQFFMNLPTPIGYDANSATVAPCGGFSPFARTPEPIQNFTYRGFPFRLNTNASDSHLDFNIATFANRSQISITNAPPDFKPLVLRHIHQIGQGSLCLPNIAGREPSPNFTGTDDTGAVIQVVQHTWNATYYQCMAVNMQDSAPISTPDCFNSTGVTALWEGGRYGLGYDDALEADKELLRATPTKMVWAMLILWTVASAVLFAILGRKVLSRGSPLQHKTEEADGVTTHHSHHQPPTSKATMTIFWLILVLTCLALLAMLLYLSLKGEF